MTAPVIGGYTLLRVLGRGGMGEVHLASTPAGGLAAVKVIHPSLARDPAFQRRFSREVDAARRVARFCTAPVLDAGISGEVAYLVTEYVKGPDLAHAVREQGPFTGGNLESLAVGIATALTAIHGAGVIHRDLKPSNVLLSPLGPRVIDFGIAQLMGVDSLASQAILGTPAFMAPEQVRGEPLGPSADVFAWGGVIAFAGTGRLPFGGGAPAEVLYRIVSDGPQLDGLDPSMRGIVEWAMAKDPARRPTPQQLLAELVGGQPTPETATMVVERTWSGPVAPASAGSGDQPAPPQRPHPRSPAATMGAGRRARRWWPWAAGALTLVAAAAVAGFLALRSPPTDWPYRADFGGDSWETGRTEGGVAELTGDTYELTTNPGWRLWRSAPVTSEPESGAVVVARGRMVAGTGEFGVWCRGASGGRRYEFAVTSDGRATIAKRGSGTGTVLLDRSAKEGTKDRRIVAECRSDGPKTVLRLWVDDRYVGMVSDTSGPLGPGSSGVFAAPDTEKPVGVRFSSFAVQAAGR
ncbi:serine/threonine-protein kinase [Nonomuraea dietziae]|uniref:serine/threonine-protein kinase n=1 Tax=Nonomuraea dietziae TaxID=65515 RepID=UPI003408812F